MLYAPDLLRHSQWRSCVHVGAYFPKTNSRAKRALESAVYPEKGKSVLPPKWLPKVVIADFGFATRPQNFAEVCTALYDWRMEEYFRRETVGPPAFALHRHMLENASTQTQVLDAAYSWIVGRTASMIEQHAALAEERPTRAVHIWCFPNTGLPLGVQRRVDKRLSQMEDDEEGHEHRQRRLETALVKEGIQFH